MKKLLLLFLVGALVIPVMDVRAQEPTIVDLVLEAATDEDNPEFTILLQAVQSADPSIAAALSDAGAYTVFAPTDAAFEALLAELDISADELLANTDLLNRVLQYHVVDGVFTSEDILTAMEGVEALYPFTLNGAPITISLDGDAVKINQATVSIADVEAANGIIHIVDQVLLPPGTLAATLLELSTNEDNAEFTVLLAALDATGLLEALANEEQFLTVFAPTDAAFAELLESLGISQDDLLADTDNLSNILLYHVVAGYQFSGDLAALLSSAEDGTIFVDTLLDQASLGIAQTEDGVLVDGAILSVVDIVTANGVIHVVDGVLIPDGN